MSGLEWFISESSAAPFATSRTYEDLSVILAIPSVASCASDKTTESLSLFIVITRGSGLPRQLFDAIKYSLGMYLVHTSMGSLLYFRHLTFIIEFLTAPDTTTCASAFSLPEDRNAAYAHIQKEIQALEAAIRSLKVRHNSLSFISRLPAELLSWIFELLALSEGAMAVYRKPHCVGVSHVCSQWRHTALECPRVWTHIQGSFYPRWALEMLKRSKMAPITLKGLACWGSAERNPVMAALEQLPRIEHLELTIRCGWPKLKEIFSLGAAPLLHTFQITSEDDSWELMHLPENIFSGSDGAPQLRCLSLRGCSFNWKFKFLCSLTHLTVLQVPTECRLSVNDLITNLGNMPQLESIHLSSVLVPLLHPEPNAPSSPSTLLPFITRIHFEENLMSCIAFFTKFTYPNTVIISIRCSHRYRIGDVAPSVRDLITTINAKNIVPITSLSVENLVHGMFRGQDSQGIKRVSVEFQGHILQPSSISWDSLPMHHLKSLQVGIQILRSVWLSVFGKLKNLKTIVITDHPSEFLDAFCRGISFPAGAQTVTSSQPAKRLNFSALKFLSLSGHQDDDYGIWPWPDKLVLCFRERRRRGLALRRLCIEGYGNGADVVRRLNSLIKHVKWTEVCDVETTDEEDYEDYYDEETPDEEDYEDYYDEFDDSHYQ